MPVPVLVPVQTGRPAVVELRCVSRSFGRGAASRPVLAGIDLAVAAGETIAVLGPSGSGKCTLLRLVAGLDTPSDGAVLLDGEGVRDTDRRAAVVFQDARLMAWRSLASDAAFGPPGVLTRAERRDEVARRLDVVGLKGFERHRPSQVSGRSTA
ncbi:ATP-binding cassette domain-containing protein [Streptomyces hirsutus]|uniref:ATP-binding cassette domain-containing protein n=1 Tax=Streptomyces hirsutus TaxID=35620 RepID=UPI0036651C38